MSLSKEHVPLRLVNQGSENLILQARAIRFCDYTTPEEPEKRQRLDIILLDEEGTMIEARVPEYWHKRSPVELKEDLVYRIKYFRIIPGKTKYRPVQHNSIIQFTNYTKITEIRDVPDTFPLYGHNAVTFDVLRTRVHNDVDLSDIVAIVTECGPVKQQKTGKQGIKPLRNLTITDGSETASIALWGQQAETFDIETCLEQSKNEPVVVLFCGIMCKLFNEKLSLQGSVLCKCYINPKLPQAISLKQRYSATHAPIMFLDSPSASQGHELKTVTELTSVKNPHKIDKKKFIVDVKVKCIAPDQAWWYTACITCNRKIQVMGDTQRCSNPNSTGTLTATRYKLTLIAIEPAAELTQEDIPMIRLVFFGAMAEEIIGLPVQDLKNLENESVDVVPSRIKNLFGKIFGIRVSVSRTWFDDGRPTYQVNSIVGTGPQFQVNTSKGLPETKEGTTHLSPPQHHIHTISKQDNKGKEKENEVLDPSTPEQDGSIKRQSFVQTPAIDIVTTPGPENENLPSGETDKDTSTKDEASLKRRAQDSATVEGQKKRTTGAAKRKLALDP